MSSQGFSHKGKVIAIEESGEMKISINRTAACDGCHAKSKCGLSGGEKEGERVMSIIANSRSKVCIGDNVEVSITYRVGVIAVMVAYITPLIIFITAIAVAVSSGLDQGLSAAVAFVVAAIYYGVVYLCRGRFEKVVDFEVRKL